MIFCEICLGKHLWLRVSSKEPVFFGFCHMRLFLAIQTTRSLIVPNCTILVAHNSWCNQTPREFLHADVECVVGKEVCITDLVLSICVPSDIWNQTNCLFGRDHGQFHGNENVLQVIGSILVIRKRSRQWHRSLTTVDDLQACNSHNRSPGLRLLQLYLRRCGCDTIVVGKEHARLIQNRIADSLIDFPFRCQKGADIPLQKPATICIIKVSEHFPRNIAKVGGILTGTPCLQAGNTVFRKVLQVNNNIFFPGLGCL